MRTTSIMGGIFGAILLALPAPSQADPCGLVPPILWAGGDAGNATPIKRIGVQKTYVFYRHGMETIALRPGFSGNVDEFGMLIPFPTPPAIRKLPDNVFDQIAAAIDPPEVVVDVRRQDPAGFSGGFGGGGLGGGGGGFGGGLGFVPPDQVRVIREEAVGMYEVAVLAAGSATALKRWMDEHHYAFPSGMDVVCPEYIQQRWCFVAVKTKVKQKAAAEPRPGQRQIDDALPAGAAFDGHVQAMGFRFHTRELVVPMRLSVHNSGELRNVVYLLSDTPSRIRHIPTEFVRRQISGEKLYDQMTEPLPLRIIGGTIEDVPLLRRRGLNAERDPRQHNGVAAELFASDIVAARLRRLESRSERFEKELFKINEALGLRGDDIDRDVKQMLFTERAMLVRAALQAIKEMTLTVIDGDFPRDVLARENLTFAEFQMDLQKSNREHYDANKLFGHVVPLPGTRYLGPLDALEAQPTLAVAPPAPTIDSVAMQSPSHRSPATSLLCLVGVSVAGIATWRLSGRQRRSTRKRWVVLGGGLMLLGVASLGTVVSLAEQTPPLHILVKRLGEPAVAERTADQITALGEDAMPAMIKQSLSREPVRRGWAIVCLGRIGGKSAVTQLRRLQSSKSSPPLVKSWSAAALFKAVQSDNSLEELSKLILTQPPLSRTVVQAAGSEPLIRVMLQSKQPDARRQAAAYVAALATSPGQNELVLAAVVDAFDFNPGAAESPWQDGPLFLPALQWTDDSARDLVGKLLRWSLWADEHGADDVKRQIANNLRNTSLARTATFRMPASSANLDALKKWKQVVGNEGIQQLLEEQGLSEKYAEVLDE